MKKEKGFTLIELLVVISIIAMLLSILMPALAKVKYQALRVVGTSNIRGQLVIQQLYATDNNGKYHPHDDYSPEYVRSNWADNSMYAAVLDYIENVDIMNCPVLKQQSRRGGSFEMFRPDYYDLGFGGNWKAFTTEDEMLANLPSIFGSYMWLANYRCTWPSGTPTEPVFNFTDVATGISVNEVPWPKKGSEATSRTAMIVHRISDVSGYFFDHSHKGAGFSPAPNGFVDFATTVDNPIGHGDGSVNVTMKSDMKPRAETTAGIIYY